MGNIIEIHGSLYNGLITSSHELRRDSGDVDTTERDFHLPVINRDSGIAI